MTYFLIMVLGVLGGAVPVYVALQVQRRALEKQKRKQDARALQFKEMDVRRREFEARIISYEELSDENTILRRDLSNIDVNLRKLRIDRDILRESQEALDKKTDDLGKRYLKDTVKWIGSSLTPNNYPNRKNRLQKVIDACRSIGKEVPRAEESELFEDLKAQYEKAVRAAFEREEQARIRAQIREEQKLEREVDREVKHLERERVAIQAALDEALAGARDEHSAEIERLRAELAEAEEGSRRAISRAQMTKSGHVYVISNIGSFGDGVFKVGLTRRLEPMVRVRELGDASVPFPFDVHMMISSDDAPALEMALHRSLHSTTAPLGHGLSLRHEGNSSILMPLAMSAASVLFR